MNETNAPAPHNRAQTVSLDRSLEELFEAPVAVGTAPPSADCVLLPSESSTVSRFVEGRRREYATVRTCARKALAALGHPGAARTAILSGPNREPLWPQGYVGSLSHSRHVCCAVVARRYFTPSIGIDVECAVDMNSSLIEAICSPAEMKTASRLGMSPSQFAALAFSGKESFYKAYFPLTRQFLDFADVCLNPQSGDDRQGIFSIHLRSGLPLSDSDKRFIGKWLKRGDDLFTGVTRV